MEFYEPEPQWHDEQWTNNEGGWRLIGSVSRASYTKSTTSTRPTEGADAQCTMCRRKAPTHTGPYGSRTKNKFGILSEDETQDNEDNPLEIDIEDIIKTKVQKKKKMKAKQPAKEMEDKNRTVIKVKDEDEIDQIIAYHMKIKNDTKQQESVEELIKKNAKMIAGLTVKKDTLAACADKADEWTRLSMAVDSGACESVIDAAEHVPGYEVQETRASKSGLVYASATGEEIPNLGEVTLPMMTKEHTKRSMKMQVAEVSRPLASVKRICEAGHVVVFDGSFIYNKLTGEFNQLREESGNYMFDVWVPPREAVSTFHRQ